MEHGSVQSSSAPQEESAAGSQSLMLPEQLAGQGPVRLKQYLTECEQGIREPANLDLILDVSEYRATSENSMEWAEIAIRAANLATQGNPPRRHSYLYRAMLLRTVFIARVGSRPGHSILDPATVTVWFLSELRFGPEEARRRSERWKDPGFQQDFAAELERQNRAAERRAAGISDHDAHTNGTGPHETSDVQTPDGETPYIKDSLNELLELQLIRYRLQLLRRLAECGELPSDPALNEWLQTARHLP